MYLKDKEYPLTIRFSKEEIEYLKSSAKEANITPSKFLRLVVNTVMRREKEVYDEESMKRKIEDLKNTIRGAGEFILKSEVFYDGT